MKYVWTWKGQFFGYISKDLLFTKTGKCVGKIDRNNIYDNRGIYIGEVMNNDRLITCISKKNYRGPIAPNCRGTYCGTYTNYVGYVMYAGYEEFPSYESFE
ncbi:hypothetical protein H9660_03605 [Clostridium sp. Sa3CUN1]|uniref:Uncharacterized protein n=1 Tax=Clostridium gallinarum TaxID=2762246 RepID=A0ABR8Q1C7_9CLOT|nr:hypothetical protein [Clostridium gallinarum]MBD7914224.1 hypothetical protein [Clostridium gallinarum]